MKVYIYSFINKINGHRYIGKTNNPERRLREHKSMAFNPKVIETRDCLWYQKIREYGWENFDFEILEVATSEIWAEREVFWIEYYNTYRGAGYNMSPGGDLSRDDQCILTDVEVQFIYDELLNTKMSQKDIATEFSVSQTLISNINQGLRYFKEEYKYPLRKNYKKGLEEYSELIFLLKETKLPFREIAERLGMAESSVKKINYGKMHYDENMQYPIRPYKHKNMYQ